MAMWPGHGSDKDKRWTEVVEMRMLTLNMLNMHKKLNFSDTVEKIKIQSSGKMM